MLYFPTDDKVYHKYVGGRSIESFESWLGEEKWNEVEAREIGSS